MRPWERSAANRLQMTMQLADTNMLETQGQQIAIAWNPAHADDLLAGLADDTFGKPTSLPWAVNLGDGIGRHPVQVYEVLFLLMLGAAVSMKRQLPEGARFRIFMGGYLAWRVAIDFLKPQPLILGMNLIQWSCLAGIVLLVVDWVVARRGVSETLRA